MTLDSRMYRRCPAGTCRHRVPFDPADALNSDAAHDELIIHLMGAHGVPADEVGRLGSQSKTEPGEPFPMLLGEQVTEYFRQVRSATLKEAEQAFLHELTSGRDDRYSDGLAFAMGMVQALADGEPTDLSVLDTGTGEEGKDTHSQQAPVQAAGESTHPQPCRKPHSSECLCPVRDGRRVTAYRTPGGEVLPYAGDDLESGQPLYRDPRGEARTVADLVEAYITVCVANTQPVDSPLAVALVSRHEPEPEPDSEPERLQEARRSAQRFSRFIGAIRSYRRDRPHAVTNQGGDA